MFLGYIYSVCYINIEFSDNTTDCVINKCTTWYIYIVRMSPDPYKICEFIGFLWCLYIYTTKKDPLYSKCTVVVCADKGVKAIQAIGQHVYHVLGALLSLVTK